MTPLLRNLIVCLLFVLVQLATFHLIQLIPGRVVYWSWQLRMAIGIAVFLILGALAYRLLAGLAPMRFAWVASCFALPPMVEEAIGWADPGYPRLGLMMGIMITVIALIGALLASRFGRRNLGGEPTSAS